MIVRNFPRIAFQARRLFSSAVSTEAKFDHLQEQALKENCILVNENDVPIGKSSKRDCHKVGANGELKLHRAFSVFLFNSKNEMLIQRRSVHKITFPDTFTNACCSHPLFDFEDERLEKDALGIRKAAQRRLHYELGIPMKQVQPEEFQYLTRIHYESKGDGQWGEHEIDYILFLHKDVDLNLNPNEISEARYVQRHKLDETISNLDAPLTPWFKLILNNQLKEWWDNLHQLEKFRDFENIKKFPVKE